ncbi:ATP-binding cassette domain-containing protein [Teredinibacter turnerae]|uniref:ATP-binding cassette domain-containing protein n=1 Tax=Teredinibacter turnerae TaxID=2426 RepID=UPI0039AFE58B
MNGLMGSGWPPLPEQIKKFNSLLDELGLTPLVNKMPSGIYQNIGEYGWQLSHGERSRLFLARALMQDPNVMILDEIVSMFDPELSRQCLQVSTNKVPVGILIHHF